MIVGRGGCQVGLVTNTAHAHCSVSVSGTNVTNQDNLSHTTKLCIYPLPRSARPLPPSRTHGNSACISCLDILYSFGSVSTTCIIISVHYSYWYIMFTLSCNNPLRICGALNRLEPAGDFKLILHNFLS